MIQPGEAEDLIKRSITPLSPVQLPMGEAAGLTLAADVYAPGDIPLYPQSSMDGYAFSFSDRHEEEGLVLEGVITAGERKERALQRGKAVRIFTGAAVPPGADTVVMQEKTRIENGRLIIEDEQLTPGGNVRQRGSEIRSGECALGAGTRLTPAAVGFLSGIGIHRVTVYPAPSVFILVTGNELQQPGHPLSYGEVYESNSATLTAALTSWGVRKVQVQGVPDDRALLAEALKQALEGSDLVLLTGGVSVGDYDFVPGAAAQCGVQTVFHKIRQRPGKPLFFGMRGNKPVFGLPGNPSSVLTCFYRYTLPALGWLSKRDTGIRIIRAPLASPFRKAAGLTHFLKGYYDGHSVTPLGAQESYRMHSFARANCLIQMEEEQTEWREGREVTVYVLPL